MDNKLSIKNTEENIVFYKKQLQEAHLYKIPFCETSALFEKVKTLHDWYKEDLRWSLNHNKAWLKMLVKEQTAYNEGYDYWSFLDKNR